ncbi:MAG: OmpA family protein [Gemmatimonadales bacterium]|nr:MAG: OmpA family protein [Gemmatimonadales bacterium]
MKRIRYGALIRSGVLLSGTALMLSACAHVKPDEMEAELAQVRAEMRAGDQAVEDRVNARVDQVETRLAGLESDLRALRDDFDVTVERLESALRFNTPVHFAFDDDQVRTQDRELLNQFAAVIADYYSDATVTVEGFTDSAGNPEYNKQLGQRRAESVKSYLQTRGLASDRLRAVSYGEAQDRQIVPGARGPGTEGWQNRRVSMVIDFNPQSATMPAVASSGSDDS